MVGHVGAAAEVLAGPLASTGGRHGRGNNVFDAVAGADATVVARRPPAIFDTALRKGCLPVVPQEIVMQPGAEMGPRQHLVGAAVAWTFPRGITLPAGGQAMVAWNITANSAGVDINASEDE